MTPLRLGIVTPVVTLLPKAHARWERTATIDDVVAIAQAADRLGFHHLTASEHVAVPETVGDERGTRYWDPAVTLGHLAAVTTSIRLATHVVVLGYHHPLALAKLAGTLDLVSKGRAILGVGVGSLHEEFDLLGAPFADRGERADDALVALRAAAGEQVPGYDGTHHRFAGMVVDPPAPADLTIWVGGRTARSLRRAVELGDGWCPFGLTDAEVAAMLARAAETEAWHDRDRPLDVVLQGTRALDPLGDPAATSAALAAFRAAGATAVSLRLVHHSPAHYIEQLEQLTQIEL